MTDAIRLTITHASKNSTTGLEVSEDTTLEIFKTLIEVDLSIPRGEQILKHNNKVLSQSESTTLGEIGLKNGGIVVVEQAGGQPPPRREPASFNGMFDFSDIKVTGNRTAIPSERNRVAAPPVNEETRIKNEAEKLMKICAAEPHVISDLRARNPPIGEALASKDIQEVIKVLTEQFAHRIKEEEEHRKRMAQVAADPLSAEAQKILEEEVHKKTVDELFSFAQEHMPESFANVVMLYVNIEVNGIAIKAFVDSGAQSTIMSKRFAEKCNLLRFVDRRFKGVARGVGTSPIIGRIHTAQIKIGTSFFGASITVLEDDKMDFLLGLDMLRRHQMSIDLKDNVLRVGAVEVPFLGENELVDVNRLEGGDTPVSTASTLEPSKAFPPKHIQLLMDLGFGKSDCINALELAAGNTDHAATWLMSHAGLS